MLWQLVYCDTSTLDLDYTGPRLVGTNEAKLVIWSAFSLITETLQAKEDAFDILSLLQGPIAYAFEMWSCAVIFANQVYCMKL